MFLQNNGETKKLVGTLMSTKMYQGSMSNLEISPAGHSQIVNPDNYDG